MIQQAKGTNIIAAVDEEGGIGKDGKIPWKIAEDMYLFRLLTYGYNLLVGRKTYESMGPLEGRQFYVLSESGDFDNSPPNIHWIQDLQGMKVPTWIAGGESVYKQFIGKAENVYLSRIPGTYDCDTFFPEEGLSEYDRVSEVQVKNFTLQRYQLQNGGN